jgi:phosphoserine phosphatase
MKRNFLLLLSLSLAFFFTTHTTVLAADPLPSWNDGKAKQSIIEFVKEVTKTASPDFVPVAERIAVFDNDGTLWSEKPAYFQLLFAIDTVKALAPKHPEWKEKQSFKAAIEGDPKTLFSGGEHALLELVMASHAGNTTEEFERIVTDWISPAKHPRFNRPYTECVFQPMLEVLTYLRANGFKTWIVSGGGIEFMRPWVEKVYGIPPEQVIGSSIKTKFEIRDGKPVLVRLPEIDFIDDKAEKPVGIHKFIGRRPIAAFGNSDGDLQMLQWTAAGPGARFCLYVHHTDEKREWAYDRNSSVGRLDKGLDEAKAKGWTVVDMKKDWKQIYPPLSAASESMTNPPSVGKSKALVVDEGKLEVLTPLGTTPAFYKLTTIRRIGT